jgi:hypothetical protein
MSLTSVLLLVSCGEFRAQTQDTQSEKAGNQIHAGCAAAMKENPHAVALLSRHRGINVLMIRGEFIGAIARAAAARR